MKTTARHRQCLADIALQECGSFEAVFAIAERNGVSVTDDLEVGQMLSYELTDVLDKRVVAEYAADGICPATMVDDRTIKELITVVPEDGGLGGIIDSADPVEPIQFTNVFTSEFTTQFA